MTDLRATLTALIVQAEALHTEICALPVDISITSDVDREFFYGFLTAANNAIDTMQALQKLIELMEAHE